MKTPQLNVVLAQLMDKGEQVIQKMTIKTKYKQLELPVRKDE